MPQRRRASFPGIRYAGPRLGACPALLFAVVTTLVGCDSAFGPSFRNTFQGGFVPLTPGPASGFILVRVTNDTEQNIAFVLTTETIVPTTEGNQRSSQTFRLFTQPGAPANDVGVLVDCSVTRIGLGENLDRPTSDSGLFIGAEVAGTGGFGVPPNIPPLDARNQPDPNFVCGDTVIFRASAVAGTVGGVLVRTLRLPASEQPTSFEGPNTFLNAAAFLQSQVPSEESF